MKKICQKQGFTLIELLTVMAIIAILSAITFTGLGRLIGKATERSMVNNINLIHTAMVQYMGDHATYPPGYGFIDFEVQQEFQYSRNLPAKQGDRYFLKPYLYYLGFSGEAAIELHDIFSIDYDSNEDELIGLLEYSPIPQTYPGSDYVEFPPDLYDGSDPDDMPDQLKAQSRPFVYAPVNLRQYKKVKKYWINTGDYLATTWDANDPLLQGVHFPPSTYDAYALIGVGPRNRTFGIVDPEIDRSVNPPVLLDPRDPLGNEIPISLTNLTEVYHVRALRAFFLAERDLNQNNEADFHFDARSKRKEGSFGRDIPYPVNRRGDVEGAGETDNALPDREYPDGYGPWLHVVGN